MTDDQSQMEDPGDLTQKRYRLRVAVKFFRKTVNEEIGGKKISRDRKMVLLIPQDSDQRTYFLNAWLPETQTEYFELAGFLSAPVDSPCRFAIFRGPDEKSEKHYLFVMTKGVEDVIVKYVKEGTILNLETFKAAEDGETDHAIDVSEGNYDLIAGHTEFKR